MPKRKVNKDIIDYIKTLNLLIYYSLKNILFRLECNLNSNIFDPISCNINLSKWTKQQISTTILNMNQSKQNFLIRT